MSRVVLVLSSTSLVDIANCAGVSGSSVYSTYKQLTSAGLSIEIATNQGTSPEFTLEDPTSSAWIRENKHLFTAPQALSDINVAAYDGICIPDGLGAIIDLSQDKILGELIAAFQLKSSLFDLILVLVEFKVKIKVIVTLEPICAIGYGVAGLSRAMQSGGKWLFSGFNLTGVSNFEAARFV